SLDGSTVYFDMRPNMRIHGDREELDSPPRLTQRILLPPEPRICACKETTLPSAARILVDLRLEQRERRLVLPSRPRRVANCLVSDRVEERLGNNHGREDE